jgi:hypothetical protein
MRVLLAIRDGAKLSFIFHHSSFFHLSNVIFLRMGPFELPSLYECWPNLKTQNQNHGKTQSVTNTHTCSITLQGRSGLGAAQLSFVLVESVTCCPCLGRSVKVCKNTLHSQKTFLQPAHCLSLLRALVQLGLNQFLQLDAICETPVSAEQDRKDQESPAANNRMPSLSFSVAI